VGWLTLVASSVSGSELGALIAEAVIGIIGLFVSGCAGEMLSVQTVMPPETEDI